MTIPALRWRFDVHAFRLLGRDLITDRVTALFELVKNAYDADATEVCIEFSNVKTLSESSKIIIRDNGEGMSLEDLQNKWMVVGTNSKRTRTHSLKFNRRLSGDKGIGRFAVDKLGGYLKLRTKKENEPEFAVTIDWNAYENAAAQKKVNDAMILFTEMDNPISFDEKNIENHGTILEISNLHELWSDKDLQRLELELSKMVSPFRRSDPFEIILQATEMKGLEMPKSVQKNTVDYYAHSFFLDYDLQNHTQSVLHFDAKAGALVVKKQPLINVFGPIKVHLYYFDDNARKKFNNAFNKFGIYIDGFKMYRDGVLTTPFAQAETQPHRQKDVLDINKRLRRDAFDGVSSRELIGFIDITKDGNPQILEATNRQDFIQNEAYKGLKHFLMNQLKEIEKYKKYKRETEIENVTDKLSKAEAEVYLFFSEIDTLVVNKQLSAELAKPLKQQALKAGRAIKAGRKQAERVKKEAIRRENIYISLMSIQDYAANVAHAVRTTLSGIKDYAYFFKNHFPNPDYNKLFLEYAIAIYTEMLKLEKAIDFMLSYAQSNNAPEDFNLKQLIIDLLSNFYKLRFDKEQIKVQIEIQEDIPINANKKFIEDIFQNLISNSMKALQGTPQKIIKCSGYIEKGQFICYFSDNGSGIKEEDKEDIFDLYFTTTEEQGGAGLGLYIVRTRLEALKGSIDLVESEFAPFGVTFKITLPFNQK
ncbi:MAG: hypothetical protein RLZZ628_885 [Bacteroidota bacterium]|jgi:signal transduction histidine kinase